MNLKFVIFVCQTALQWGKLRRSPAKWTRVQSHVKMTKILSPAALSPSLPQSPSASGGQRCEWHRISERTSARTLPPKAHPLRWQNQKSARVKFRMRPFRAPLIRTFGGGEKRAMAVKGSLLPQQQRRHRARAALKASARRQLNKATTNCSSALSLSLARVATSTCNCVSSELMRERERGAEWCTAKCCAGEDPLLLSRCKLLWIWDCFSPESSCLLNWLR